MKPPLRIAHASDIHLDTDYFGGGDNTASRDYCRRVFSTLLAEIRAAEPHLFLLPGDLFTNIVGASIDLTLDDAWEAARQAGLAKDIEAMPMGMHTVITEGAATLSGGQRQRLMIARALVTRPRIVFFDEATSALDNPTQAIVTDSLDRMRATRIVIAHRLSTILNADRIFVLDRGRVVQSGTYDELVSTPGLFHDLVKRQIA